jgi:hypothetical protein
MRLRGGVRAFMASGTLFAFSSAVHRRLSSDIVTANHFRRTPVAQDARNVAAWTLFASGTTFINSLEEPDHAAVSPGFRFSVRRTSR